MKEKITAVVPKGKNRNFEGLSSLKENNIPFILEEGPNPSKNRNIGAKKVNSEYTAFINAHTIIPSGWKEKVVLFFHKHPKIDIVGGPQLTASTESRMGTITGYALSSIFGAASSSNRYSGKKIILNANEKHITSANLVCKSSVLEKLEFDESLYPGEDPKFISDAKSFGFNIAFSPEIYVYHKRRPTISEFSRQIFNYGSVRPQKETLLQSLKHLTFTVPAFFVIYLSLFSILSIVHSIFLAPLILYTVLLLSFSFYEGIRNSDFLAIFVLPFIFFTIHIVYGLGFIHGIYKSITKK